CAHSRDRLQGPFYVKGEYVRFDISEDLLGMSAYVDAESIDVATWQPITDVYFDLWNCNAAGVYTG
ncbi:hypothetical protein EDD85DRAFT_741923, partial [Armillaria nabsnona]